MLDKLCSHTRRLFDECGLAFLQFPLSYKPRGRLAQPHLGDDAFGTLDSKEVFRIIQRPIVKNSLEISLPVLNQDESRQQTADHRLLPTERRHRKVVEHSSFVQYFNEVIALYSGKESGGCVKMDQLDVPPSFVYDQILRRADVSPQSIALSCGSAKLDYAELERRSAQFAAYLLGSNILPGSVVAICMGRSSHWVIAALGILRSGSACVPLDPRWPEARIRYAIEDSGAAALVASEALINQLQLSIRGIDPIHDAMAIAAMPQSAAPSFERENLAYIIYTSGSTGTPKGVEITHANLCHLINWHIENFNVTANDRCSHLAGLGFDAAVWEIWPTLVAGATLCIPDDSVRVSPELIRDWMIQEGVTIGFVPTVHAARLIEMKWPADAALEVLLTGGDALPHPPAPHLPFTLVNNYGPTECTVVATSGLIVSQAVGTPTIGKAITGAWVYVLDEDGRPLEEGQIGEIYIGGNGVGRGYRNLPDATRASFLPDPFSPVLDGRMYRTGDLGARRPDGQIEFHGCIDRQVKIRGQRIKLEEISNRLSQHPAIQFAIVAANSPNGQDVELTGYIIPKDGGEQTTVSDLQEYLLEHLPFYMVPTVFIRLRELPLSDNGKINLALLPTAATEPLVSKRATHDAVSQIESKLLGIVRELLKDSTISPKDNFFLAGGHSLLGMQLIMRVRNAYKVDLTARELFDGPSVEQLSTKVERKLVQTRLARIWKDVLKIDSCGSASQFTASGGNDQLIDDLRIRIAGEFGQYLTRADLTANDRLDSQVELLCAALASEPLLPPGGYMVYSERQTNNMFWLHYPNPKLAEAMGAELPFLCLTLTKQDFETLGEVPTLREIARCFIPKILASQPKGPYIIGGFCLGGIVSYEVACQLQMAGYDVALLVLLDVPSPEYYRPAELRKLMTRPVYVTKRFKQLGIRKSLARLFERASEKIQIKAERALVAEHSVRTQEIMEDAAYRYKPTRYEGKVALIMASERRPDSPPHEHFLPWWRTLLADNLHEHAVDAMHLDLVDGTAVYEVAEAISSHLKTLPFLSLGM